MKDVENIKQLLLSEDSKELGLQLAKSLGYTALLVALLDKEVKSYICVFGYDSFDSWRIFLESIVSRRGKINKTCYYNFYIKCVINGDERKLRGSQDLYHFAKKREDLIKELTK